MAEKERQFFNRETIHLKLINDGYLKLLTYNKLIQLKSEGGKMRKSIFIKLKTIFVIGFTLLCLGGMQACKNLYSIGGTITGLSGTVVLQNSDGETLTSTSNGDFTFSNLLVNGSSYNVTVLTQPSGQICTPSNNSGTINNSSVTNILITCTNSYTVGGSLSNLGDGESVILQNNSGDNLTLASNGSFTFSTPLAEGATYNVTVLTQPTNQTCIVTNGSGTVSSANITDVVVTCTNNITYTIGGTLSNLGGSESVILQNNSGDNLNLTSNGSFTFSTPLAEGANYNVTVFTQPSRQICSVTNGTGTVSNANITNVTVDCVTTNPILFVTAASHNGNFGGISGADNVCMTDANKPSGGTYKAFLVDGTNRRACATGNCTVAAGNNIDWVLAPNKTYYRSDGTTPILTTNGAGIFVFGTLTNSFLTSGTNYWTGLFTSWITSAACTAWTSSSGASIGRVGVGNLTNSQSISDATPACDDGGMNIFLICAEQ